MFKNRLAPLLLSLAIASGASPQPLAAAATPVLPTVSAQLYITNVGYGNYLVVVDGHSSAHNAAVGVRVYGEDTWLDDFLFSMVGTAHTDPFGNFNLSQVVYRTVLNEDWEGQDEVYAIASVSGGGSVRTNTIVRSF